MGLINNKLALLMGTTVAITSTILTNTKVKADTDANSSLKEVTVQNDNQSTSSINTQEVTLQSQSTKDENTNADIKNVASKVESSSVQSNTSETNVTSTDVQNNVESSNANIYESSNKAGQSSDINSLVGLILIIVGITINKGKK